VLVNIRVIFAAQRAMLPFTYDAVIQDIKHPC